MDNDNRKNVLPNKIYSSFSIGGKKHLWIDNKIANIGDPAQLEDALSSPPKEIEIETVTTFPDEFIRHDISDEELTILCHGGKQSNLKSLMWCGFGVSGGFSTTIIKIIDTYWNDPNQSIKPYDLLIVILFVLILLISFILFFFTNYKTNEADELAAKIRNRKKRKTQRAS